MECDRCNESCVETLGNGEAVCLERLTLWKQEVGTPVFIDARCIAALGRLGQSMNQSNQIKSIKSNQDGQGSRCTPTQERRYTDIHKHYRRSYTA